MKQLLIENEKLILEINRINQIMGQNLITEGVVKPFIDFLEEVFPTIKVNRTAQIDNVVNGTSVRETAGQIIDRLQQKVYDARRLGNPLPLSNVMQDLYVLAKRDTEFLIKVTDYIMSQNTQIRPYIDEILRKVDRTKPKSEIIDNIRDGLQDAFNQVGIPKSPYTEAILDRAVLDYEYVLKFPTPSIFSKILSKLPIRDARILSNMMYNAFLPLVKKQSQFIQQSRQAAEYMAEKGKVPKQQLDNMLAILASTKKVWDDSPRIVLNKWKNTLKNDPNSRVSQEALDELDMYIASGDGKEIWDDLAKIDKDLFYPLFDKWRKLWPFKKPSSQGGLWIFSDVLTKKEYWERVMMTIIFKSPETFKDWYKFLSSQGMTPGLIKITLTKAFSGFVVLPLLETLLASLASISEDAYNFFADPEVDFVDYQNFPDEISYNMSDNFLSQIKNFEVGKFIDDRTWADEFAYIIADIIASLYEGKLQTPGSVRRRVQQEIQNMQGVPQSVRDAFRTGRVPRTSPSPEGTTPSPEGTTPSQGTPTPSPVPNTEGGGGSGSSRRRPGT
jgi:hypothetical protein